MDNINVDVNSENISQLEEELFFKRLRNPETLLHAGESAIRDAVEKLMDADIRISETEVKTNVSKVFQAIGDLTKGVALLYSFIETQATFIEE